MEARLSPVSYLPPFAKAQSKAQLCGPLVTDEAKEKRKQKVNGHKDFNIISANSVKAGTCLSTREDPKKHCFQFIMCQLRRRPVKETKERLFFQQYS